MDSIVALYMMLAIGAAVGWFIGVLMTSGKIQELEDEIAKLKADKATVSNRKRVKK